MTLLFTVAVYALAAFLMFNGARYWFRPLAEGWLREHKVVLGMSQYVKDPREGAKLNLLFSFTPIAFCIHCYVMGITEIDEFIFMSTFLIGQSPHIVFGLLTGSALLAADTSPSGAMDSFKIALLVVGIVGTLAAMVYLMSVAESVLNDMENGAASERLLGGSSERCGVGITFEEQDDKTLKVAALLPGSPAALSGEVRVGDVLCEIDGRNVYRASLGVITQLVPGERGTRVELGLGGGGGPVRRISLMRRQTTGLSNSYGAVEERAPSMNTAETQTPPQSPDKVERGVTWGPNSEHIIEAGESSFVSAGGRVVSRGVGVEASPVLVTVESSTL